uniref:Uncharacterized protein n=1 Tax=Oryza punctata TaxID=4537 RepID=A0A0E0LIQ6_ORYPU
MSSPPSPTTRRAPRGCPAETGRHYDGELDSWVSLHFEHDDLRLLTDGRLCACGVVSVERGFTPPEVKVSKDKVFVQVPGWEHVDAELVYMGGRSEYCLVEWLRREGTTRSAWTTETTACSG